MITNESTFNHKNSDYLKNWTKKKLPNNGFFITDIDLFIRSKYGCFMIVEIKCKNSKLKTPQKISYEMLDYFGQELNNSKFNSKTLGFPISVQYHGTHVLKFENTSFEDGKVYWDGNETTEEDVIKIMSFNGYCEECFKICT